jgi:hypothetical protein
VDDRLNGLKRPLHAPKRDAHDAGGEFDIVDARTAASTSSAQARVIAAVGIAPASGDASSRRRRAGAKRLCRRASGDEADDGGLAANRGWRVVSRRCCTRVQASAVSGERGATARASWSNREASLVRCPGPKTGLLTRIKVLTVDGGMCFMATGRQKKPPEAKCNKE